MLYMDCPHRGRPGGACQDGADHLVQILVRFPNSLAQGDHFRETDKDFLFSSYSCGYRKAFEEYR